MPRKGWDSLSQPYRARLQRNGITQSAYESGTSLRKARGHAPRTGQRSERFDRLVRLAERNPLHWAPRDPKNPHAGEYTAAETILAAMASGMSMAKIDRLIRDRIDSTDRYRNPTHPGPGAYRWHTRTEITDRKVEALYWYHP